MEVPGIKQDGGNSKGAITGLHCFPCVTDGTRKPAHGFCQDCQHYLCKSCYDVHKVPFPSRNHKLLDMKAMPRSLSNTKKRATNRATLKCDRHADKPVEIFCTTHSAAVCGVCAHKRHGRPCETVDIDEASDNFKRDPEYTAVRDTRAEYKKLTAKMQTYVVDSINNVEQSSNETKDKIIAHRDELIANVQKLSRDMIKVVEDIRGSDTGSLNAVQAELDSMDIELDRMESEITGEQNDADLFVKTKDAIVTLHSLQERLSNAAKMIKTSTYQFTPGSSFNNIINMTSPLGSVERFDETSIPITIPTFGVAVQSPTATRRPSNRRPTVNLASAELKQLSDIAVKASQDERVCAITSMTLLSPDRLLLVDLNNQSVKIVNIVTENITSRLQLSGRPWEATILPQDKAAVTLPGENKIQVICTKESLSAKGTIKVSGKCYGIGSSGDKLVVGYDSPPKVEIINLQGGVLTTISTDASGQPMFKDPWYIAVGPENEVDVIYVSDRLAKTVIKMTLTGQIIFTYRDKDLNKPRGLAVTTGGQVLVCSFENDQLHLLSSTGTKIKTLLQESDGLYGPECVCTCDINNKLYVSKYEDNIIQVFKVN